MLKNFEGGALDWVGLVSNCTVGQFLGTSHSLPTHAEWTIMHLVSPQNFAWPLFLITPGYYSRPKRNRRQWLCKVLGGEQGELWSMWKWWIERYSQSSLCDHSCKRPALVTSTFVKPCLNCDWNFFRKALVSDRSHMRPRPLLGLPNRTFPLFLSSCNRPLKSLIHKNQHYNETAHCANGLKNWT